VGDLIAKIIVCLLIAAAIGFLMGWLLNRLRIAELEDEIKPLRNALRSRDDALEESKRFETALQTQLAENEATLQNQREELNTANNETSSLRTQYHSAQSKIGQLEADLKTRDASVASLNAIVSMRDNSLRESELKANLAQVQLAKAKDELKLALTNRPSTATTQSSTSLAKGAGVGAVVGAVVGASAGAAMNTSANLTRLPRQFKQAPAYRDDLRHLYGVDPEMEGRLFKLGVYFFRQVALWTKEDVAYFDQQLNHPAGRIERERWIRSAIEEQYKKYGEWLGEGDPIITIPETDR
jgi:predicted flap endonuclease-1-like 5' DNA nuclease